MKQIKIYFKNWGFVRILRFVLGLSLAIAYGDNNEIIFLIAAIVLLSQALFNLGCSGRSCSSNNNNSPKPVIEREKFKQITNNEKI